MSFFTRASYARLMEELTKLRTAELPAVSRAKQVAAAEGDLSENAEYHATRERLDMLQRRIYDLADQLRAPSIQGGQTHHLTKGDVITIPAKTPHWWKEVPTKTIAYYAVNMEN